MFPNKQGIGQDTGPGGGHWSVSIYIYFDDHRHENLRFQKDLVYLILGGGKSISTSPSNLSYGTNLLILLSSPEPSNVVTRLFTDLDLVTEAAPAMMASFLYFKGFSEKVNVPISQWGWTYVCLILFALSDTSKLVPIFKPLQILFRLILTKALWGSWERRPSAQCKHLEDWGPGTSKWLPLSRVSCTNGRVQVLCRS